MGERVATVECIRAITGERIRAITGERGNAFVDAQLTGIGQINAGWSVSLPRHGGITKQPHPLHEPAYRGDSGNV
ncbi:hypothetical protein BCO19218_00738 [Burkholderia contaminans]|nr:hypothetical protein BCO19218_00738 [Burkholderia contaminans]